MSNQVQNKPTAAYIVSLIGGVIGLIASIFVTLVLGVLAWLTASAIDYGYDYGYDFMPNLSGFFIVYIALGVWMLITSILVIVFARKLNADPMQHTKYGVLIIIFSIIGVGGILGLIGGILALVYKPIPAGLAPQYQQQPYYGPPQQAYQPPPQAHPCPQCGTMVQPGVRFCPNCGKQQY
jgi:ABC-type transport system involved in multi-copper enzyme maturation permease subunit